MDCMLTPNVSLSRTRSSAFLRRCTSLRGAEFLDPDNADQRMRRACIGNSLNHYPDVRCSLGSPSATLVFAVCHEDGLILADFSSYVLEKRRCAPLIERAGSTAGVSDEAALTGVRTVAIHPWTIPLNRPYATSGKYVPQWKHASVALETQQGL